MDELGMSFLYGSLFGFVVVLLVVLIGELNDRK